VTQVVEVKLGHAGASAKVLEREPNRIAWYRKNTIQISGWLRHEIL